MSVKTIKDKPAAFLPYGRQCIDQNDIDAVLSVLKSDWLTQGPKGPLIMKYLLVK